MRTSNLILICCVLGCGGCTPQAIVDAKAGLDAAKVALADAKAAVAVLEAKRAEVAATIDTLPEADKPAALALLAKYDETIGKVKDAQVFAAKRIAELEKALANADDWVDVALGVLTESGALIPVYGAFIAALGGVGLAWWKAHKQAQAGVQAIQGIEAGKDEAGNVMLSDPIVAAKVSKVQGDAGAALVDKVTKPPA